MRSWLLLTAALVLGTAQATERPDPADEVRAVVAALKNNDAAGAILAAHGDSVLRSMLSAEKSQERVDEQLASAQGEEWVQIWSWLREKNIDAASSVLYPKWQAELPKALASAQMGLGMVGMHLAEDKSLSVDERTQLTKLAFATNAWIARTDFLDKRTFDLALTEFSRWLSLADVGHPVELELTNPEQRVELAKQALVGGKRVGKLYGVDVDAVLDTVKVSGESVGDDRAIRRISLRMFDVTIQISEELEWVDVPEEFELWEDGWMPKERAEMVRSMQRTPVEPADESQLVEPQDLTDTGCSVPVD